MHPVHMEISKEAWDVMAVATSGTDRQLLVWAAGAARLTWANYFLKAWWWTPDRAQRSWHSEAALWEMWQMGWQLAPGRWCRFTHAFEIADSPSIGFGHIAVRVPWTACAALMCTADPAWQDKIRALDPDAYPDRREGYELGWQIWETLRPATVQPDLFGAIR